MIVDDRQLPEFVSLSRNGKMALVHPAYQDAVADALFEGVGCTPADERGRGKMLRFEYADGTGLIRRYLRGGFIRHFITESYLLSNRARQELEVHRSAYERGVPVPMPLGVCWERRGFVYRGSIATQRLAGGDLMSYLSNNESPNADILRTCGVAVRAMHDAGIFHADLQVKNILLYEIRPFLVDFDRGRVYDSPVVHHQRTSNLERLKRSFLKNGLSAELFDQVCEGYGLQI